MTRHHVVLFKMYPLEAGQRIRIEDGPRRGDWEVVGLTDRKMRLRCPVTFKEVEWDRFCCLVRELENEEWPERH